MAKFLDFESFIDDGEEDFMSYVERFDHYWKVTQNKDDSLKKSAFITAIGKRPYKTLKDLLLPAKPEDKSFVEIVAVLREHYSPGSKVIAERFKFNRRYQMEGETISAFAVELRHMAARFDFGPFLDDALRDRFVAGLSDASIQASLLTKKELSFETAYDLARSAELAAKESKGFRPTSDKTFLDEDVHVIQKGQQRQKARTSAGLAAGNSCYRCAEQHDVGDCPYRKPPVKTGLQLRTYGGAPLEIVGQAEVPVVYREQRKTLPVVAVPGRKPSLLGRDWLAELRMDWKSVFTVQTNGMVEDLLRKYSDVFSTEVGLIKGHKAQLVLKEDARPVFCKARPVPFSLRTAVEEEIQQLERNGVLVPVAQSDWATPVVVVPKADKKEHTLRIDRDYARSVVFDVGSKNTS
ncbi:uncharacterized protein [Dermacentor albipictus]|uniref:uncharacterized protein n=1 Tax=Dermacentor albipictus TaxID=60249 RepID=UPI0031FDAE1D